MKSNKLTVEQLQFARRLAKTRSGLEGLALRKEWLRRPGCGSIGWEQLECYTPTLIKNEAAKIKRAAPYLFGKTKREREKHYESKTHLEVPAALDFGPDPYST